jgi:hypothetical protein
LRQRKLSTARYFDRIEQDLAELEKFGEAVMPIRALVRTARAHTKLEVL